MWRTTHAPYHACMHACMLACLLACIVVTGLTHVWSMHAPRSRMHPRPPSRLPREVCTPPSEGYVRPPTMHTCMHACMHACMHWCLGSHMSCACMHLTHMHAPEPTPALTPRGVHST